MEVFSIRRRMSVCRSIWWPTCSVTELEIQQMDPPGCSSVYVRCERLCALALLAVECGHVCGGVACAGDRTRWQNGLDLADLLGG